MPHDSTRLTLWRDLTPLPRRLKDPELGGPHVLVIGGGVTGLTTSWVLLDKGYNVTIVSDKWASFTEEQRLTAQIAGALWEFPPAVCGSHTDAISLAHSKKWAMTAYHIWDGIVQVPALKEASGVRMRRSTFFFPRPIEEDEAQQNKMKEIMASGVRGFVRDRDLIRQRNVSQLYGITDAYEIMAPVIDTDQAMQWLMKLVKSKGALFVTERIENDLLDVEDALLKRFEADVIVNATGLQSELLAGDKTVYPLRGGMIRVINDGTDFPKVETALAVTADAARDSNGIVFLVPRNDNILLIGGIAQPNNWILDLTLDSAIIRQMRERCEALLPALKNARVDPIYPLAQGLRPSRPNNIRVERELRRTDSRIVHSYGHGGSGWSLSFGCAEEVVKLVDEVIAGIPANPMSDTGVVSSNVEILAKL